MKISRFATGVLVLLVCGFFVTISTPCYMTYAASTPSDPPCDSWRLHTRTLPDICPEVVIEGLSGQGIAAIGMLTFDAHGALYVSRPATGEVLRLVPDESHHGKFLPMEIVAAGLNFPDGLTCADLTCYVATETQIVRLSDNVVLVSDLSAFAVHPLHLDSHKRLWTTSGNSLISVNLDGSDERVSPAWPNTIADFGWIASGTLWASDNDSHIWTDAASSSAQHIDLLPNSAPTGLTFYPDQSQSGNAFPQFTNGLFVVTSGSWNKVVLTGFELWFVPFSADKPGNPQVIIPANTDLSNSNAALYLLTFFPDHPVAIAISPEGWIYVAMREGRIIRLRPRNN